VKSLISPSTVTQLQMSYGRVHCRSFTCLEQSSSVDLRLSQTFSTFKTHLKSHLFNFYSLQFDCITDNFLYRALEAACAAYAYLNLSLLHYITLYAPNKASILNRPMLKVNINTYKKCLKTLRTNNIPKKTSNSINICLYLIRNKINIFIFVV